MEETLEYYFEDESHVIFEKYTIDTLGIIKNKKSGKTPSYRNEKYNRCDVTDNDGKRRGIFVCRAVASTFLGKPPTPGHTADHIESEQKKNDALTNIRWATPSQQRNNQIRPESHRSAFIIVKDGVEKTVKEWVNYMFDTKTPDERKFTESMINHYARNKQHGFTYKEYPDLPGEDWREIEGSKTKRGDHWEISNMNRVRWVTNHASNVLCGERLGRLKGYPRVKINGKQWLCHILAFQTFHPKLWAAKKPEEMVRHEDDNKDDFRPHKLRLGTASDNVKDSHNNGKRDGTKTMRIKCASYVDGVLEKEHISQKDAAEYIKLKGCSVKSVKNIRIAIGQALSGKLLTLYGRTWQKII